MQRCIFERFLYVLNMAAKEIHIFKTVHEGFPQDHRSSDDQNVCWFFLYKFLTKGFGVINSKRLLS